LIISSLIMSEGYDAESHSFEIYKGSSPGFANPRLGFVRKVYGIISCQLACTTFFVFLAQTVLQSFFQPRTGYANPVANSLFYLAAVGSIVTSIVVACFTSVARKVPTNYILLGIFTLCESYIVAYFTTFFRASDVLLAAFLTCALTITLTIYAWTTKSDFTIYGGALWIIGWALFAVSILLSLITFSSYKEYQTVNVIFSVIVVCFYGFYLLYDTQIIMGGKRFSLELDDYILAAMVIYIDIIILFMRILRIVAAMRGRD